VERSAHTQRQLVENLLDISQIIAGTLRLELQPVELPEVVHAALDAVRPSADSRGIQLDAEVEDGTRLLQADARRLRQVVAILLTNALKFSERGGRVLLRLRRVGAEVVLQVTDTGQGIPPTFLPHLFERFRQADSSATRKHGGLGVELAIARHVVKRHGGTIEAHSEGEGRGATFTVRLPEVC
jgi:signal transduction histidine kinase